ncbi:MAG: tRNA (cmo5U34)-methyltransferase [Pirellulaceae bacterium]|jgi:tRNA (cmo5U34)-methyltransferase
MGTPLNNKSTNEEIQARFDADVERFSNLDTGQQATMDAPLAMELITHAAIQSSSPICRILDIGCGAGNNTLKLLSQLPTDSVGQVQCHLLDLSDQMLERAKQRVSQFPIHSVRCIHADLRAAELQSESYDVLIAAAVLHHLRDDDDWLSAFEKIYDITAPGGSVWITDLVIHENSSVHEMMWRRYGDYLQELGGSDYREKVFAYIDKEDSPRPVTFQLELLRKVGFQHVELLHKQCCFAAFGAVKSRDRSATA